MGRVGGQYWTTFGQRTYRTTPLSIFKTKSNGKEYKNKSFSYRSWNALMLDLALMNFPYFLTRETRMGQMLIGIHRFCLGYL